MVTDRIGGENMKAFLLSYPIPPKISGPIPVSLSSQWHRNVITLKFAAWAMAMTSYLHMMPQAQKPQKDC
jgi:hypothetical protein